MADAESTTGIEEYVTSVINQIQNALPEDVEVGGVVTVELSTVVSSKVGGGFQIQVLQLGAKVSSDQVHQITIPLKFLSELDRAQVETQIEQLKTDIVKAKYARGER